MAKIRRVNNKFSLTKAEQTLTSGIDEVFGDGSDGSVTISSGQTVYLSNDVYYEDLTIESGGTLFTNGFRIFVNGTLTNNGSIGMPDNIIETANASTVSRRSDVIKSYAWGEGDISRALSDNTVSDLDKAIGGYLVSADGSIHAIAGGQPGEFSEGEETDPGDGTEGQPGYPGTKFGVPPGEPGGPGNPGNPGNPGTSATRSSGGAKGKGGGVVLIVAKNVTGSGSILSKGTSSQAANPAVDGSSGLDGNPGNPAPDLPAFANLGSPYNEGVNAGVHHVASANHPHPAGTGPIFLATDGKLTHTATVSGGTFNPASHFHGNNLHADDLYDERNASNFPTNATFFNRSISEGQHSHPAFPISPANEPVFQDHPINERPNVSNHSAVYVPEGHNPGYHDHPSGVNSGSPQTYDDHSHTSPGTNPIHLPSAVANVANAGNAYQHHNPGSIPGTEVHTQFHHPHSGDGSFPPSDTFLNAHPANIGPLGHVPYTQPVNEDGHTANVYNQHGHGYHHGVHPHTAGTLPGNPSNAQHPAGHYHLAGNPFHTKLTHPHPGAGSYPDHSSFIDNHPSTVDNLSHVPSNSSNPGHTANRHHQHGHGSIALNHPHTAGTLPGNPSNAHHPAGHYHLAGNEFHTKLTHPHPSSTNFPSINAPAHAQTLGHGPANTTTTTGHTANRHNRHTDGNHPYSHHHGNHATQTWFHSNPASRHFPSSADIYPSTQHNHHGNRYNSNPFKDGNETYYRHGINAGFGSGPGFIGNAEHYHPAGNQGDPAIPGSPHNANHHHQIPSGDHIYHTPGHNPSTTHPHTSGTYPSPNLPANLNHNHTNTYSHNSGNHPYNHSHNNYDGHPSAAPFYPRTNHVNHSAHYNETWNAGDYIHHVPGHNPSTTHPHTSGHYPTPNLPANLPHNHNATYSHNAGNHTFNHSHDDYIGHPSDAPFYPRTNHNHNAIYNEGWTAGDYIHHVPSHNPPVGHGEVENLPALANHPSNYPGHSGNAEHLHNAGYYPHGSIPGSNIPGAPVPANDAGHTPISHTGIATGHTADYHPGSWPSGSHQHTAGPISPLNDPTTPSVNNLYYNDFHGAQHTGTITPQGHNPGSHVGTAGFFHHVGLDYGANYFAHGIDPTLTLIGRRFVSSSGGTQNQTTFTSGIHTHPAYDVQHSTGGNLPSGGHTGSPYPAGINESYLNLEYLGGEGGEGGIAGSAGLANPATYDPGYDGGIILISRNSGNVQNQIGHSNFSKILDL